MNIQKRLFAAAAAALLLPSLTGCQNGSLYSNYREVEQLQVIQTLGVDHTKVGDVRLSISSGADIGGRAPSVMSVESPSISKAMEKLQDYASRDSLFFAHTHYLLIGEDAARKGTGEFLDFLERMPQMRTDVSLFITRESEAATLIAGAGDGQYDVTDELSSLEQDVQRLGGSRVYSCVEVSRRLAESGAALVCAIAPADTEGIIFSGGGGLSTLPAGYAVLKDGKLIGYISDDTSKGVNLLEGTLSSGPVAVWGEDGGIITLSVTGSSAKIKPVWREDGSLQALRVEAEISAAIQELENSAVSAQDDYLTQTAAQLAERARGWIAGVLAFSAEQGADFLALGQQIRRADPVKFASMPDAWPAILPHLAFDISVTASIQHGYENSGPINMTGNGIGGTE